MKRRDEFLAAVHEHTTRRATAELLADAALFRIPSGPVLDGSTIPGFDHFVEREVFTPDPTGRFLQPRVPYRIRLRAPSVRACRPRASTTGRSTGMRARPGRSRRRTPAATRGDPGGRLHRGGPAGGDSGTRAARGRRRQGGVGDPARPHALHRRQAPSEDGWWEWGPMFHAANAGKRGITLDLGTPTASTRSSDWSPPPTSSSRTTRPG